MKNDLSRRAILRGTFAGMATTVALPILNRDLNGNGTAFAATGAALPLRFGSWFQHLGLNPGMWMPAKTGAGYQHNIQLKVFDQFRSTTNVYSGLRFHLDGRPHETHTSSVQIATTGIYGGGGASLDSNIADAIGKRTRFRSIELALSGGRQSLSRRSATSINPGEPSPMALYARVFGPEFRDPNAADFKPDPMTLARRSVLSTVSDRRQSLERQLGAADRARIDEYFTGLREIEQKLSLDLERPAPMPSCSMPVNAQEVKPGSVIDDVAKNTKLFGDLVAHAMACDQTRVFSALVGSQGLRRAGSAVTWHTATHEESVDDKLGYQKEVFAFLSMSNQIFADFLRTLEGMKEGAGSVYDRTLVIWQTDHGDARTHSLENVPLMTFGTAGGRFKGGMHIASSGDPYTRVGLTVQQGLGVPMNSWGDRSNQTSKTISEMIA